MITQARLGLRLQRFEVIAVVVASLVVGLSALIVRSRLDAIGVPADCWAEWFRGNGPPGLCEQMANGFWSIREGEADLVMASMAVLPSLVGLFLGAPVVARETEGGTAPAVWALAASRTRWLAGRLLPLVVLLVLVLGFLAIVSDMLVSGRQPWMPPPTFDDVGLHGPGLVGRGLAAMGLALLAGAVLGRVVPAIMVGAVLCVVLAFGSGVALSAWAGAVAETYPMLPDDPVPTGTYFAAEGWLAQDGRLITDREEALRLAPSGVDPHEWLRVPEAQAAAGVVGVARMVPASAYPAWSVIETILLGGLGIISLALTFGVVERRGPQP